MKSLFVLFLFFCLISQAQVEQLIDQSYLFGRDYYVLRSGNAKMVVQCDKADVGPAFGFMLFDAREPAQTARKDRAFNYVPKKGFSSTALEVNLGKDFPRQGVPTLIA